MTTSLKFQIIAAIASAVGLISVTVAFFFIKHQWFYAWLALEVIQAINAFVMWGVLIYKLRNRID